MSTANPSYSPADTTVGILDMTAGDLLRQAAEEESTRVALVEVNPPGGSGMIDDVQAGDRTRT